MNLTPTRRKIIECLRQGWTLTMPGGEVQPKGLHGYSFFDSCLKCRPPAGVEGEVFPVTPGEASTLHQYGVLRKFRRGGKPRYELHEDWYEPDDGPQATQDGERSS